MLRFKNSVTRCVSGRQGASAIGVIVMSAAGIVVGTSLISMNLNIARLQKKLETRSELSAWKTLAGQYLSRPDSKLCESFIGKELPPEADFCQKLRTSSGDQACSSLETALAPGTIEACSLDPQAKSEERCPELFLPHGYPQLASLPPPPGYSGQSKRLILSRMARGPRYSEAKPEYLAPIQLVIGRSEPTVEVQQIEPGLVTLRLKGGAESDARVIESCSLGAIEDESPKVEALCEQLGLAYDAESERCGVFVAPKNCASEGKVVVGVDSDGTVICDQSPAVVPPVASQCRGWVNAGCYSTLSPLSGWRFASDGQLLERLQYCEIRSQDCRAMGGRVSDVDTLENERTLKRLGNSATKKKRHHSCVCL